MFDDYNERFLRNLSNTLCRIDVERLWATNEKNMNKYSIFI